MPWQEIAPVRSNSFENSLPEETVGDFVRMTRGIVMGRSWALIGAMAALSLSAQAGAQEKSAVREGFSAESLKGQRILLFRPTVWVGEQSTAGLPEPNADWTATARDLLLIELRGRYRDFDNEIVEEPDLTVADARMISAHRALFSAVANSVMVYQFFPGNRLPTRKHKPFVWTLGEETRKIAAVTGSRYGLFITTQDQYGSTGRKIFQFLAAGLVGVGIQSGLHQGYAGLVDLETGQLLWLNADGEMGGDVRDSTGMQKRVGQLLEDFPGFKPRAAQ